MEDDTESGAEQLPESLLPYDEWTEAALRHVMVQALRYAAENGLPAGHHFYITFRTDHPGTVIPPRLKAQYPTEMTIVLQHQFRDLLVDEVAGLMSVGLSFNGIASTLRIPLRAIAAFADPYVRQGMAFRTDPSGDTETAEAEAAPAGAVPIMALPAALGPRAAEPADSETEDADKSPQGAERSAPQDAERSAPQVVSLDAFRRKTPPKS
jgi:hypothetical protein